MIESAALDRMLALQDATRAIDWDAVRSGKVPAIARDSNTGIYDLEGFADNRRQFRGVYSTASIDSFAKYLEWQNDLEWQNVGAGAMGSMPCFIDGEAGSAAAFLDIGNVLKPGHCLNRAVLKLEPTAAYAAIVKASGQQTDQRGMANFLEDWRRYFAVEEHGPPGTAEVLKVLRSVRSIDISTKVTAGQAVTNHSESRSGFVALDANANKGLPDHLWFICKPFAEFGERRIEVDLSTIFTEPPKLTLRIRAKEALFEDIAVEFQDLISDALPSVFTPVSGAFKP